jgi:hypothetical protein
MNLGRAVGGKIVEKLSGKVSNIRSVFGLLSPEVAVENPVAVHEFGRFR